MKVDAARREAMAKIAELIGKRGDLEVRTSISWTAAARALVDGDITVAMSHVSDAALITTRTREVDEVIAGAMIAIDQLDRAFQPEEVTS